MKHTSETEKLSLIHFLRLLITGKSEGRPEGITEILNQLVDQILIAIILIYPLALFASLYRILTIGWRNQFIIQVSFYLVTVLMFVFRKRIPYQIRVMILLGIGFIAALIAVYIWGLSGMGFLTLTVVCIFFSIMFGTRAGIILLVVACVLTGMIGMGVVTGKIHFAFNTQEYLFSPSSWIVAVSGLFLTVAVVVICFGALSNHLNNLIKSLNERAEELEKSKEDLEKEIEERINLEEQLLQSQKMEAVGRLAGGVAHDFNNQLLVILNIGEILKMKLGPEDPRLREVGMIIEAGERSAELTRQLLAFSRKQIIEPKILMINDTVKELTSMFKHIIGEDIDLTVNLDQELGMIKIDPTQFEQIVINLAVNARDAMPDGGKLTIGTRNEEIDEVYANTHLNIDPGPYVMLTISDTGEGMDKETLAHIFEPFFTTKAKNKGTGLGLSMVYGITRQCNGDIFVYSERGVGTTFKIFFPRVGLDTVAPEDTVKTPVEKAVIDETIFVVEDDGSVRQVITSILGEHGYDVIEASNGKTALEIIRSHEGKVDLLITDVVMPEINGKDLMEQFVALKPETRVLYISGYDDNVITHHGILDPGIDFLQKPFNREKLLGKVREVLS